MNRRDIVADNLINKGFDLHYDDKDTVIVQIPLPKKKRQLENQYIYYGFVKINIIDIKVLFVGLFVGSQYQTPVNSDFYKANRKVLNAIKTIRKICEEAHITKEMVIKELEDIRNIRNGIDLDIINYLKENLQ